MLEGAFSFRGRIGRLDFFLASLLMLPAALLAGVVMAVLMATAERSTASLVFFGLVAGLMVVAALWYSLSLQVRRFRDIGWDPLVVIVGWMVVGGVDAVVAAKMPALALGHGQHGTALGAVVNVALSLALLFWPGRDPDHIGGACAGPEPRLSRSSAPGAGPAARAEALPAPARIGVRKEFGRRGVS